MTTKPTQESIQILKEALSELESVKGSVLTGVQKLSRAAKILGNTSIEIWCEIQFGNKKYTLPLKAYTTALLEFSEKETKENAIKLNESENKLKKLGLIENEHYSIEELDFKYPESGGGFVSIGFIEERYADLIRIRKGNDGTYYKHNLNAHISYVKNTAHSKATQLYNIVAFSDTPQTCFDVLKANVDDKLLDLNPKLAEQLMLAFKCVSTDNKEEWSQSLSTCRRFIEYLADELYPPTEQKINGRSLCKEQYINRIWAFMDKSIESESNKELAKAHIDFIGNYLQKIHKLNNKGVHTQVERLEAVKTVFHIYLILADLLEYLDLKPQQESKLNIYSASIDEIQSYLNVSKNIAKEIIKLRVEKDQLNPEDLKSIKGIGPKTISKAKEIFHFSSTA